MSMHKMRLKSCKRVKKIAYPLIDLKIEFSLSKSILLEFMGSADFVFDN